MSKDKETAGLKAIMKAYDANKTDEGNSIVLFASHHIDELDAESLISATGHAKPDQGTLLSKLILLDSWEDEDTGAINMDYTLPNDVTTYMLCVKYDKAGELLGIEMES